MFGRIALTALLSAALGASAFLAMREPAPPTPTPRLEEPPPRAPPPVVAEPRGATPRAATAPSTSARLDRLEGRLGATESRLRKAESDLADARALNRIVREGGPGFAEMVPPADEVAGRPPAERARYREYRRALLDAWPELRTLPEGQRVEQAAKLKAEVFDTQPSPTGPSPQEYEPGVDDDATKKEAR